MAYTDKDAIYEIAEKLGYTGDEGLTTTEAVYAVAAALGYTGEHDKSVALALSDLKTVVGGGGGGGDFETVTVTLNPNGNSVSVFPSPYILNDELLSAKLDIGGVTPKSYEFVIYKDGPASFEYTGAGSATASGDATVDEDYVEITGDCTITFSS